MLKDIRDGAFEELYRLIKKDRKIILISVDQGALIMDKIGKDFPNNLIRSSIAEQNSINFAAGLAKGGFKPYVYLISPFIARAFEQVKINICSMKLKINIIGSGSGFAYASDGVTHYFLEDYGIFKNLPNINIHATHDYNSAKLAISESYKSNVGGLIKLEKGQFVNLKDKYKSKIEEIKKGKKTLLITYGYMSQFILKEIVNHKSFKKDELGLAVINSLIPLDIKKMKNIFNKYKKVLFIEETPLNSSVFQSLSDQYFIGLKYKRILHGQFANLEFTRLAGSRNELLGINNLDKISIIKKIKKIK